MDSPLTFPATDEELADYYVNIMVAQSFDKSVRAGTLAVGQQ